MLLQAASTGPLPIGRPRWPKQAYDIRCLLRRKKVRSVAKPSRTLLISRRGLGQVLLGMMEVHQPFMMVKSFVVVGVFPQGTMTVTQQDLEHAAGHRKADSLAYIVCGKVSIHIPQMVQKQSNLVVLTQILRKIKPAPFIVISMKGAGCCWEPLKIHFLR